MVALSTELFTQDGGLMCKKLSLQFGRKSGLLRKKLWCVTSFTKGVDERVVHSEGRFGASQLVPKALTRDLFTRKEGLLYMTCAEVVDEREVHSEARLDMTCTDVVDDSMVTSGGRPGAS